jgi:hypothetical protein
LRFGVFALLDKPLNRATFLPLVQQAIECHRLREEVAALRRTLKDSGVVMAPMEEVFQPLLPY